MSKTAGTTDATTETASPKIGRQTTKLVPLQKRLDRLRKEEAKRKRQLDKVTAESQQIKKEMADLIASVNDWVQKPEAGS